MSRSCLKYILLTFTLLWSTFMNTSLRGQTSELGHFPLYNFTPKQYNALDQNWCAIQDHRGIMYIGNNRGVLEYDGVNWNLLGPSNASPVRSLAVDEQGRIYFGAEIEFGYLQADSLGQLKYVLLSDLLGEENQEYYEILATHVFDDGIIFQAYHHLFIWKHDSLRVIKSEEEINETFLLGDKLFISYAVTKLGLLVNDEIELLDIEGISSLGRISGMIEQGDGPILIVTESEGFYELRISDEPDAKPVLSELVTVNSALFTKREIFDVERISPNRISLATWGYGAIIIDSLFNIVSIIDKQSGLQDQVVQGQYCDKAGNLWLTLSSGISRIEVLNGLTHFDDNHGLEGTIQSVTRCNNRVYVTSNTGLYYMIQQQYKKELTDFSSAKFHLVDGFDKECWEMITFQSDQEELLLVATNDEVLELNSDHTSKRVYYGYPYSLLQSNIDPKRLFIGLEEGLISIYKNGNSWEEEILFEEVEGLINNLYEDERGILWLGTENAGIYRIQFDVDHESGIRDFSVSRYNQEQGLPSGPFIIQNIQDATVIATNKGIFVFNEEEAHFFTDSIYGQKFSDGTYWIHRICNRNEEKVFMVSRTESPGGDEEFEIGYLIENEYGNYDWKHHAFNRVAEGLVHALYPEPDGITWFGGSDGLYRYDESLEKDYSGPYRSFVRHVATRDGRLLFGGVYSNEQSIQFHDQPESLIFTLPYRENSLVFNYSAEPGEDEKFNSFSYFLEGYDKSWSEWSDEKEEKKAAYTNLHEGNYMFHVKARNIYGNISSEATYEFSILAPWYRTVWAFIAYVILAVLLVYLIVIFYTRRLRAIIRERTAEVVSQKEVIEVKNNELMDSILYAEKIQRAMMPPEDDLDNMDLDGFILFRPLNIVSGDFYWLGQREDKIITVAADCTGHGVPGAFMSMLGVAFLNNIIGAKGILTASEILDELRAEVIAALKQKGHEGEQKDGMDLALHVIDKKTMKLEFAGANNPLVLIRNNELIQVKADRMPIGIHELADIPFKNEVMDIQKGDVIYTFSDGFQDQFGGPKNKKFMVKRLKELFLEIHRKPMSEQKEILQNTFNDWIVPYGAEQIDDVIVIGIRI